MLKRRRGRYLNVPRAWIEERRTTCEVSKVKKEILREMGKRTHRREIGLSLGVTLEAR